MDSIHKDLSRTECFIRQDESYIEIWKKHLKLFYDGILSKENKYKLNHSSKVLDQLFLDGLDCEQVWQQVELLNDSLVKQSTLHEDFDQLDLSSKVEQLASLGETDPSIGLNPDKNPTDLDDVDRSESLPDEGLGSGAEESDSSADEYSDLEDDVDADNSDLEDEMDDNSDMEADLEEQEDLDADDVDTVRDELLQDFSDSDKDEEFGDLAQGEDTDDNDSDTDDDKMATQKKMKQSDSESDGDIGGLDKSEIPKFSKTSVDSQFLTLRESEWIADNDMIGENCPDTFDDVDFMSDNEQSDEDNLIKYDDFFGKKPTVEKKKYKDKKVQFKETDEINEDSDMDEDHNEDYEDKEENEDNKEDSENKDENKPDNKEEKSLLEKLTEKDMNRFKVLEENNIADKEWVMKGETQAADRPENSVLEEDLEYTISVSQRPTTTEETTKELEKFILGVIRSGAYDDVERKIKPIEDPYEYKKKLLLDQSKSQKSLAEIYEDEYLKSKEKQKRDENEEELPEHKEIRTQMDEIFLLLDALSNYHYTPKQKKAEVKIVSNLPALTVEEATPVTVNDATLLAPQEIVEPQRGDLLGKTERTKTDMNRERRKKKSFQKKKSQVEEIKLKKKLKKMKENDKNLDVSSSAKIVEKAVKRGQIKLMQEENKSGKSSKRKADDTGNSKGKKAKTITSSKKLLI